MKRLWVLPFPNLIARARDMGGSFRHVLGLRVPSAPLGYHPCRTLAATPPLPGGRVSGATPLLGPCPAALGHILSISVRSAFSSAMVHMLANTGERDQNFPLSSTATAWSLILFFKSFIPNLFDNWCDHRLDLRVRLKVEMYYKIERF